MTLSPHSRHSRLGVLSLGALVAALAVPIGRLAARKTDFFDSYIPVTVEGREEPLNVPVYNPIKVPPLNCSGYVRRAAEDMFGLHYTSGVDAWNRRYHDVVVASVGEQTLEELADDGVLREGMIVGFRNPRSRYGENPDEQGTPVMYTHLALYIGPGRDGTPLFAEQFGPGTKVVSSHELTGRGLVPIEILASHDYASSGVSKL